LTPHIGQVGSVGARPRLGGGGLRPGAQHRTPVQDLDQIGQATDPPNRDPSNQLRLCHLPGRYDGRPETDFAGGQQRGQHAADFAHSPIQAQFADQHAGRRNATRHHVAGRQDRSDDRQVIVRAGLRQACGSQIDGQQLIRPGQTSTGHCRPAAVPRLVERGIRQAHQHCAGQPTADRGLDLDQRALHPQQRHRPGACGAHATPRTCLISGAEPGSLRMPTASTRRLEIARPLARRQLVASWRSRCRLA